MKAPLLQEFSGCPGTQLSKLYLASAQLDLQIRAAAMARKKLAHQVEAFRVLLFLSVLS